MSRLKLDRTFFGTIDRLVGLLQRIDAAPRLVDRKD
jgi:hypothetical protein